MDVEKFAAPVDPRESITSDWIRSEEEVLASELSYRRLFEAAQDGILILDAETGRVDDVNPYLFNLLGFTRSEMVGKTVGDLSPFKDIESNQAMLERLQEQGYVRYENLPMETRDGRKKAVEFVSNVYQAGDRKVIQCNIRDITERKKVEAQFMRAQRMESIGTLAGGIAHDLNNILSPIMMSIDILKTMSHDPQATKILETIEASAKKGSDIVRQVLSLASGLEGDGTETQHKHLLKDLEKIIKDTFPRETRLKFSLPDDAWTTVGDASLVPEILLNICVNTQDAVPHQGHLTISVENYELNEQYATMHIQAKVGRYVSISVAHSKSNLSQGILDNIFEPFFIDPEGRNGKGDSANLPRGNGETVLIVDDEASILTITSQTLEAYGYRTLTARDGAEAVAVYAQHRNEVAVVLTDMMMPVMNGPDTIKVLRRINPAVKIVASSGLHLNGNVAKGGDVKYFLPKPYSPAILLQTIQAILAEV